MNLPKRILHKSESYFTIDYRELREVISGFLSDKSHPSVKRSQNRELIGRHTFGIGTRSRFHGYSTEQLKRWIAQGYKTDLMSGLSVSPVREKRHYQYVEDGEEIFVDRALSGEDSYMGEWTKRQTIPGVAIEAEVMFAAMVKSEIVNAYNVWICKAVQSLEMSGIDCQLTIKFSSEGAFLERGTKNVHSIVRVKKENEQADFHSFSPMLSPATLRTFGFTAICLHAESAGQSANYGLGTGRYNVTPRPDWGVKFDTERRVIMFDCPYMPRDFPEGKMTAEFRSVVTQLGGHAH